MNQVAPLYLSEMAPYQYRGGMNVCFQLCITIGVSWRSSLVLFLAASCQG